MLKPPTDHLYKFMAIAGLLLMGIPPGYLQVKRFSLEREVQRLEGSRKSIALERDYLSDREDAVKARLEQAKGLQDRLEKDLENLDKANRKLVEFRAGELTRIEGEISEQWKDVRETGKQIAKKQIELETKVALSRVALSEMR